MSLNWTREKDTGNYLAPGKLIISRNSKTSSKRWFHRGEYFTTLAEAKYFAETGRMPPHISLRLGTFYITVDYICNDMGVTDTAFLKTEYGYYDDPDEIYLVINKCSNCGEEHRFDISYEI